MNVNDGKWFRSLGAEKLMEAEEREVKMYAGMNLTDREKNDLMFGKLLEAIPNDTAVEDKCTGKKMILLGFTNHAILAGKDGEIRVRDFEDIKVLLSDDQKKLLEED